MTCKFVIFGFPKAFLYLLMQIKALESLLQICFIWNLKFKYWSMYRPKNLIVGKSDFVVMLSELNRIDYFFWPNAQHHLDLGKENLHHTLTYSLFRRWTE